MSKARWADLPQEIRDKLNAAVRVKRQQRHITTQHRKALRLARGYECGSWVRCERLAKNRLKALYGVRRSLALLNHDEFNARQFTMKSELATIVEAQYRETQTRLETMATNPQVAAILDTLNRTAAGG